VLFLLLFLAFACRPKGIGICFSVHFLTSFSGSKKEFYFSETKRECENRIGWCPFKVYKVLHVSANPSFLVFIVAQLSLYLILKVHSKGSLPRGR
jgi:hypothetical protein